MSKRKLGLIGAALLGLASFGSQAAVITWAGALSEGAVDEGPTGSAGTATATFTVDDGTGDVTFTLGDFVNFDPGTITGINVTAGGNPLPIGPGTFNIGAGVALALNTVAFPNGGMYLELLTSSFPNGEIAANSFTDVTAPVPVPAALVLMLSGLGALGVYGRRKRA